MIIAVSIAIIAAFAILFARQLVKRSIHATITNANAASSSEGHLAEIRKQVSKSKFLEFVEPQGMEAANQAERLQRQHAELQAVLLRKLNPQELTFAKYSDAIDRSCFAIGENLLHVNHLLENLNIQSETPGWHEQKEEVGELLVKTGNALDELGQLYFSLNEITTKEQHRDQLETTMLQITDLASRAKNYSKQ